MLYFLGNIGTTYKYRLTGEEVKYARILGTFPGMLYLQGNASNGEKYRVSGEERITSGCSLAHFSCQRTSPW